MDLRFSRIIKGAVVRKGVLENGGFALVDDDQTDSQRIRFELPIKSQEEIRIVFGFRGVGWHQQCWLRPEAGDIRLYSLYDGVRVYRNHARIAFGPGDRVELDVDRLAARVKLNGADVIHGLVDGAGLGAWGFASPRSDQPSAIPDVEVRREPTSPAPEWLIFGDGYTNPAWPLRHFVGWPELLFGGRFDYLNAAVPAGNSLRVRQIVEKFAKGKLEGSNVIFAVGADDYLEGVKLADYVGRIGDLGHFASASGARSVYLATIPARLSENNRVREWNETIRAVGEKGGFATIDFFQAMIERLDEGLIGGGDYPAEKAQVLMAKEAANVLGIPIEHCCIQERLLGAPPITLKQRLLMRAYGKLKARLGAEETV